VKATREHYKVAGKSGVPRKMRSLPHLPIVGFVRVP